MDPLPDQPATPAPAGAGEVAAASPTPAVGAECAPPHDPWAHRRGEPRLFAFLWTVFLFAATGAIFLSALTLGAATPDVVRPATRSLLAVTMVGITILWPMVRLSQRADGHPVTGCIQDLVVILIPAQAVIWPQWFAWLGRWPLEVISAVSAWTIAWAVLTGGLLALAQAGHRRAEESHRSAAPLRWPSAPWMLGFLTLALVGALPALAATPGRTPEFRLSWMLSPVTGIFEIARDRPWTGVSAMVAREHWLMVLAVLLAAAPLWVVALVRARGIRAEPGLHL